MDLGVEAVVTIQYNIQHWIHYITDQPFSLLVSSPFPAMFARDCVHEGLS